MFQCAFPKTKGILLHSHSVFTKTREFDSDRMLLSYPQSVFLFHLNDPYSCCPSTPSGIPSRLAQGTVFVFLTNKTQGAALWSHHTGN